jgi:hypothetical protein
MEELKREATPGIEGKSISELLDPIGWLRNPETQRKGPKLRTSDRAGREEGHSDKQELLL